MRRVRVVSIMLPKNMPFLFVSKDTVFLKAKKYPSCAKYAVGPLFSHCSVEVPLQLRQNMQNSLAAMKSALRILSAITQHRFPEPADVTALYEYAGPPSADMSLDEYACAVVQKACERYSRIRT